VGADWAEAHHDVEVVDETGRVLARRRLPEGIAGLSTLHALIGEQLGDDAEPDSVLVGIETDRGPWVAALVAAGYTVFAINPLQAHFGQHPDAQIILSQPGRRATTAARRLHPTARRGPRQ